MLDCVQHICKREGYAVQGTIWDVLHKDRCFTVFNKVKFTVNVLMREPQSKYTSGNLEDIKAVYFELRVLINK